MITRVEIISIGNEVLAGAIVDTNSAFIATQLYERGQRCQRMQTVPDELEAISEALRRASKSADFVLVTGGLGPTEDDLTAEAAGLAADIPLESTAEAIAFVSDAVSQRGLRVTARQLRQARLPRGCQLIPNPNGTAPAFSLSIGRTLFVFFPGPPREMRSLVVQVLDSTLPSDSGQASLTLRSYGLSESRLADQIQSFTKKSDGSNSSRAVLPPGVELGYQVRFPCIDLRLRLRDQHQNLAANKLEQVASLLEKELGDVIFARGDISFPLFVLRQLAARKLTLSLAESCTGGLVSHLLTAEAGASEVLLASFVSYANSAKVGLLGVPISLLEQEGAVSEACAEAMALGAREASGADLAVAITGMAGPGGGSETKPVGMVCFAVNGPGNLKRRLTVQLSGERTRIQLAASYMALELVRQAIDAGTGRVFK